MLNPWGTTLSESSCVGSSNYTKLWSFKKEEPTLSFCHLKRWNPVNYLGTLGTYEIWPNYCQTDKYFIRCSDVADLGLFQIASQLLGKPCPYSSENTFLPALKAVFHNCYVPVTFLCTQGRFMGLLACSSEHCQQQIWNAEDIASPLFPSPCNFSFSQHNYGKYFYLVDDWEE